MLCVLGWDTNILRKSKRVEVRLYKVFTKRKEAPAAFMTGETGHMVMHKNPITWHELGHPLANLNHDTGRLMA
jgi:hypothetical protein